MVSNEIHTDIVPSIGIRLSNGTWQASTTTHIGNLVFKKDEEIPNEIVTAELERVGLPNLAVAKEKILRFSLLKSETANVIYSSTADLLEKNSELVAEDCRSAGYNSVFDAWQDAQRLAWLTPGITYYLKNS